MPIGETTARDTGLPPPQQLARSDFDLVLRRLADDLAFGADNSLFVGSGLEYAGSRPYQRGDSIRMFDWRLTARTGKPYVREHEALKRTCVYIVLDTSASMAVASTRLSKHDIAVWMGAAIGLVAQRRMSPAAIVGAGERSGQILPSLRAADLWKSLDPLRAPGFEETTRLAQRITDLTTRAGRSALILVLSDLHDRNAIDAIRHATQRHDCAVIHTRDPSEIEPLRAGFVRAQEAESGRVFVGGARTRWAPPASEREELLRCGADYLQVRTDEPFIAPLRRFLATRALTLRGRR